MNRRYYLGIDFGTSGARAIAINGSGEIAAITRTDYQLRDYATWQSALYELISALPIAIKQNICRILIDGTSATVLLCDRQGKAIAPTMIYSDRCSSDILASIKQIVPNDSIACNASSSFAKLMALITQIEQTRASNIQFPTPLYLLHQADWLGYCLHGKLGFSDYHNALKLGYDPQILDYPDWLKMWVSSCRHAAIKSAIKYSPTASISPQHPCRYNSSSDRPAIRITP
jgi:sugar (pentulose or hexulose) kinase